MLGSSDSNFGTFSLLLFRKNKTHENLKQTYPWLEVFLLGSWRVFCFVVSLLGLCTIFLERGLWPLYFLNSFFALDSTISVGILTCIFYLGLAVGFKVSLLGLCTVFLRRDLQPLYFLNRLAAGLKCFCWDLDLYFGFRSRCRDLASYFWKGAFGPFIS